MSTDLNCKQHQIIKQKKIKQKNNKAKKNLKKGKLLFQDLNVQLLSSNRPAYNQICLVHTMY